MHGANNHGGGVCLEFLDHYESENNLEQAVLITPEMLQLFQCSYSTNSGMLGYSDMVREAVIDSKDAGKPMEDSMHKSMFLRKKLKTSVKITHVSLFMTASPRWKPNVSALRHLLTNPTTDATSTP